MYDVIIIGAGAAGITSSIYAARAKLKFEIISEDVGGLTAWSSDIENYTGYHKLSGLELVDKFKEHMKDYNIKAKEDKVLKVGKKNSGFVVNTKNGEKLETKSIVVCSGSSPRKLKVPGADEFEKKGVVYCATCDGPLFAGKEVAVIGGGDAALDAANTLISMKIKKISIININPELTGTDKTLMNNVLKSKIVEVMNNTEATEILGDKFVTSLKYKQEGKQNKLDLQGVFVEIGHIRNTDFIKGLVKLNDKNEIIVDKTGATNVPGIFAAGDVTDLPGKQTVIACGDGSRALLSAFAYISKRR